MAHPARYRPYRLAVITLYFVAAFSFVGTMIHAGVTGLNTTGYERGTPA